jgi:hypothetical protein
MQWYWALDGNAQDHTLSFKQTWLNRPLETCSTEARAPFHQLQIYALMDAQVFAYASLVQV